MRCMEDASSDQASVTWMAGIICAFTMYSCFNIISGGFYLVTDNFWNLASCMLSSRLCRLVADCDFVLRYACHM